MDRALGRSRERGARLIRRATVVRRLAGFVAILVLIAPAGCGRVGSPSATVDAPTASPHATPVPGVSPSPTLPATTWAGLSWSDPVADSGAGVRVEDIVPWGGRFVAVGESGVGDAARNPTGAFLTSADGLAWSIVQTVDLARSGERMTHVFVLDASLLAVAEGGGVDCPAGVACPTPDFSPELWTSPDGSNWTPVDSPSWTAAWSNGGAPMWVVAGAGGVLAVGYAGRGVGEPGRPSTPPIPLVVHSNDGLTWVPADLTVGFEHAVFRDAIALPAGFVIVGRDGLSDPTTEVVDPANPLPLGLGRPAAWASSDGHRWTVSTVDGIEVAGGELSAVEAGADGLFAIGAGAPGAGDAAPSGWSSTDGRVLRVVGRLGENLPAIDQAPLPGSTVLASDGRHILVFDREEPTSDTLAAWVSTDGSTWTRLRLAGSTSLPKIGFYDAQGETDRYVTGATVLPDRVVVSGYGAGTYALWLATAVAP